MRRISEYGEATDITYNPMQGGLFVHGRHYELVESGTNGFIIDPTDVGALAGAMSRIASHDCNRAAMGARSSEIVEEWGPKAFATGLRQAIHVALSQPRAPAGLLDWAIIEALRRK